jgi:hypothetical protein
MRSSASLLVLASLVTLIAVVPAPAAASAAPFCAGTITSTGGRATCEISCQIFNLDGTLVDAVGVGVTADYDVRARIGVEGCGGVSESCPLAYVGNYGPVYGHCTWTVRGSATLTCYAEEYVGAFACAALPI